MKKYYPVFWAPDLDPSWELNPGVLQRVDMCFPAKTGGLRPGSAYDLANSATVLATATYGFPIIGRATNNGTFLGTDKRLVLLTSGAGITWADKSKGAANYTTAADWSFASRGSKVFAASIANALQVSTSGGTFADVGGTSPKASFVVSQSNFVLLADTDDGTRVKDQVWTSALADDTDFNPANGLTTQAGTYLLRDTDGPITAFEPLRDVVVAYKADSIYVGEYTGTSPYWWRWRCVSHTVGCPASHGVARVGDMHYFIHDSDLYSFDGVNLRQIDVKVSNWLRNNYTQLALADLKAAVDPVEGLILWFSNTNSIGLCYNVFTERTGFISAMSTGPGAIRSSSYYTVIQGPPSIISTFPRAQSLGAYDYRHIMLVGNGATNMEAAVLGNSYGSASVHTGDIGSENVMTTFRSFIPRFTRWYDSIRSGAAAGITVDNGFLFFKNPTGGQYGTTDVVTMTQVEATTEPYPRWESVKTAHWLRGQLAWSNNQDLAGISIDAEPAPGT